MWIPVNIVRLTSPDVLSIEECLVHIYQQWDISCHSSRCILETNRQHWSDLPKSRDYRNPQQLYAARFSVNCTCKFAVTHSILTFSLLYDLQHFPLLFVIIFLTIQQQQIVYRKAASEVSDNMTQTAHSETVPKSGSSKNQTEHAIRCESIHITVDDCQLRI
jgi:hypothetical protein